MADQQALSRVLREFARTMAGNYDIAVALHDLSDSVVEILDAPAVGVALFDAGVLRFVTATSDAAAEAERIQEELQSGPCFASIEKGQPVPVTDIRDRHDDWPEYGPAVEALGLRAILGIPLVLDDRRVGSLDVYDTRPRAWDEEAVDAATVLADIGAAYVLNATELASSQRTGEQLQTALDSRIVIEQAKGVLAERLGISTSEAFQRIRASARSQSVTVAEVCRRVIETDHVPE
jgi:GAF domain-containing protein